MLISAAHSDNSGNTVRIEACIARLLGYHSFDDNNTIYAFGSVEIFLKSVVAPMPVLAIIDGAPGRMRGKSASDEAILCRQKKASIFSSNRRACELGRRRPIAVKGVLRLLVEVKVVAN